MLLVRVASASPSVAVTLALRGVDDPGPERARVGGGEARRLRRGRRDGQQQATGQHDRRVFAAAWRFPSWSAVRDGRSAATCAGLGGESAVATGRRDRRERSARICRSAVRRGTGVAVVPAAGSARILRRKGPGEPMLDDLSPAVERALAAARQRAAHGPVNAVHVFLALIEDDEGRAAQVLIDAGGDLAAVRQSLQGHEPLPFDLPSALTGAREVAGERAETTLTGEFLLLGLIRSIEPLAHPLRAGGVLVEQLTQAAELTTLNVAEQLDLSDSPDHLRPARGRERRQAREALRVVGDYTRFVVGDAVLTGESRPSSPWSNCSTGFRCSSCSPRETLGDVGTDYDVGEMVRSSPRCRPHQLKRSRACAASKFKLLLAGPGRVQAARYRSYVEKRSGSATTPRARLENCKSVLLTGATCAASLDWTIREAADGGADIFQLREKSLCDRELLERARNVRRWTRETRTLFIVNDRPDIARLVEADGVHLGQDDLSVKEARAIAGPDALIGVSTHNPEQIRQAILHGASYIGVGPAFRSTPG